MLSRVDVSNDTTVVGLRQMSEAKSNPTFVGMVVCYILSINTKDFVMVVLTTNVGG